MNFKEIIAYIKEHKAVAILLLMFMVACYYLVRDFCIETIENLLTEEQMTQQIEKDRKKFQDFLEFYSKMNEKNQEMITKKYLARVKKILYCQGEKKIDDTCLSYTELKLYKKSQDKKNLEGQLVKTLMDIYDDKETITLEDVQTELLKLVVEKKKKKKEK